MAHRGGKGFVLVNTNFAITSRKLQSTDDGSSEWEGNAYQTHQNCVHESL